MVESLPLRQLKQSACVQSVYLAEQSKPLSVLWSTSTRTVVVPVQIQTIKSMSPQEFNRRLHESLTVSWRGHHVREPAVDDDKVISSLQSHLTP